MREIPWIEFTNAFGQIGWYRVIAGKVYIETAPFKPL